MSFESKDGFKTTQKPIPPMGPQLAVCYSIVDLGTHTEQFQGQEAKQVNKVHFSWELPNHSAIFDKDKGPQPMALFQEYTLSAGDKAKLPKMLCAWGQMAKIDKISAKLLQAFLGQPCTINVEHHPSKKDTDADTGRVIMYANVGMKGLSVMPMMTGLVKPTGTVNPKMFFSLDDFSWAKYDMLPKYLQKKISESKEWSGILVKYPKAGSTAVQSNQGQGFYQPKTDSMFEQLNDVSAPSFGDGSSETPF